MLRCTLLLSLLCSLARAHEEPDAAGVLPGHSSHGESFNEGPRRRIPLTPGCGDVTFPVTTASPEAQQWFNQGVAQIHGFWYWEAERSFRTALVLDPACVMAHWGMAVANIEMMKPAPVLRGMWMSMKPLTGRSAPRCFMSCQASISCATGVKAKL